MIRREIEKKCIELASKFNVLTITGPRQSGKTTLAKKLFPKKPYINLENLDERRFAISDPKGFLNKYPKGAILDEIQRAPELTSYIQVIVDEKNIPGMFILTGSQQFEMTASTSQSLAGRTAIVRLLPLSFRELNTYASQKRLNTLLLNGFYPGLHVRDIQPYDFFGSYLETYIERDVRQISQIENLHAFEKCLQLLAARTGCLLNYTDLSNSIGVSGPTIRNWILVLEASYLVYLLQPYHSNIGKRLIKTPKIYFYDVGLATYLLGIHDESQLETHPLRGNLFENFVVIEHLKKCFNKGLRSNLYFYRDRSGKEVDLVADNASSLDITEIKSSATAHLGFTKNLDILESLEKKHIDNKSVIYGGNKIHTMNDVQFKPWHAL